MEYITSRRFEISKDRKKFEEDFRFHLWQRRLWPYEELVVSDIVYWHETPSQTIVWKSKVTEIERFPYDSKQEAKQRLIKKFGDFDQSQTYFVEGPDRGYCIALKVKVLEKVNLPKPTGLRFPQQGWLRIGADIAHNWLNQIEKSEDTILDNMALGGGLIEKIQQINASMMNVSPKRITSIVSQTIRQDTKLVKALKALCKFQCQFPDCGVSIPKRDGRYYIEVAHIQPVRSGGKSIIGNLLVLCPNHHKEFDYGNLKILEQTETSIKGVLNNKSLKSNYPLCRRRFHNLNAVRHDHIPRHDHYRLKNI